MNDKNKDYWHSRIDEIFDRNVREKKIAKIYREQYRSIEKQILELYDKAVNQEITTRTDLYSFHHFQELLKSIEQQNKNIKSKLRKETVSTLKKAYKETFLDVVDMLDSDSQWSVQNSKMLESVLNTKWEGSNFSSRIWKNTDELSRRIKADVTTAIVQGTNKDTLVKSIMKDYNAGFAKADRLVRTETMHAINRAQLDTYKGEGVEEVEWDAGLDERTCEICGAMHGKKYKVGEAPNIMHPNCRCTLIPVIPDSWFDNEYLAERDGKTAVKENNVNKLTDKNKRGIINYKGDRKMYTGGILDNGALNPDNEDDFEAAQKHALSYYEEIRKRKTDIKTIAQNTNWEESDIETVKNHIFINKYDLGGEDKERFFPHYDIAVSWQNLIDGKHIEEKDLILLRHELYEYKLMTQENMSYHEAHKIAESKYNYAQAVKEWRKSQNE